MAASVGIEMVIDRAGQLTQIRQAVCYAAVPGERLRRHPTEEVSVGLLQIIWMIIVGFIVGVIARFVYPGAIAMGFWATAAVGIIGSLIGGLIGGAIWRSPGGKFHPAGFFLSIIGALIVLWLYLTFLAK